MKNQKEDILFSLIKSLTGSEKGYFKKYISGFTSTHEPKYLKIFNVYDKQTVFNQQEIDQRLSNVFTDTRLDVLKKYLYDIILDSLTKFHAESSSLLKLNRLLSEIEVLLKKSLFDQAEKKIRAAHNIANVNHKYLYSLMLTKWEKKVYMDSYDLKKFIEKISRIHESEATFLNGLNDFHKLNVLDSKMFLLNRKTPKIENSKHLKDYNQILNNEIFSKKPESFDFVSRLLYHTIRVSFLYASNELEKSLKENIEIIKLLDKNSDIITEYKLKYIYTIHNQIAIATKLCYFDLANVYLKKLKELSPVFKDEKQIINEFSIILELNLLIKSATFQKDIDQKFNLGTHKDVSKFNNWKTICYLLSINCFCVGYLSGALKWTNYIIDENDEFVRDDINKFARLFFLLIHFELENYEELPGWIDNTSKYLSKREKLNQFDKLFFSVLKKLIRASNFVDRQNIMCDFRERTQKILIEDKENNSLEYFNFNVWAESKISGTKYCLEIKKHVLPRKFDFAQ